MPTSAIDSLVFRNMFEKFGRIFHTVQWAHCLEGCVEAGASVFFELGPGRALNGMAAGAYPDISARSLEDFRTLQGARACLARVVN